MDKIKILKIKRKTNDEVESVDGIKTFELIQEPWYDETDISVSTSGNFEQTFDLNEKTIPKTNQKSKITLVQNANSHFLREDSPIDFDLKIQDLQSTKFDTITVIADKNETSKLPTEILKLRRNSFAIEQEQTNKLLEKINRNSNCEIHPQNHLVVDLPVSSINQTSNYDFLTPKSENKYTFDNNLIKNIDVVEISDVEASLESIDVSSELKESTTHNQTAKIDETLKKEDIRSFDKTKEFGETKVVEESTNTSEIANNEKQTIIDDEVKVEELSKTEETTSEHEPTEPKETIEIKVDEKVVENNLSKVEDSKKIMEKNNSSSEMLKKIEEQLSEVSNSIDATSSKKSITQTPHQLDSSILDYTVTDQTDDMDREIARRTRERQLNKVKDENEMTTMLNGIILSADKNEKIAKQIYEMENLEEWINNPEELVKIKNLSKKEQKRLLKKMKGK